MRHASWLTLALATMTVARVGANTFAGETRTATTAQEVLTASAKEQKFTYILLWKEESATTRDMATRLKTVLAKKSSQATWTSANVTEPANRALIERLRVSRAPTPMVLCVAPNGAITAAVTKRLTEKAIEEALVTPAMTHCMKALQEGKTVLVHVKKDPRSALPVGAKSFAADAEFQGRTATVDLLASDPAEDRFLKDMEIDPAKVNASVLVVLAPPGVLVGKFSAHVTKEQIADELHAAGKCCDDPNCKHKQGSQENAPAPRNARQANQNPSAKRN